MKSKFSLEIGDKVFIRALTYHYVGEISSIEDEFIVLKNASWVADSGRFGNALETGELDEVEKYPDDCPVLIWKNNMVDTTLWKHPLPTETK